MAQSVRQKLLTYITIALLLSLHYSVETVESLRCSCNVCTDDFCETATNNESFCYKSVRLNRHDNGSRSVDFTLGCLSGGDGLLAPLQCHVNSLTLHEPTYMKCCRDSEYCNEYLPDPTENEDTRWRNFDKLLNGVDPEKDNNPQFNNSNNAFAIENETKILVYLQSELPTITTIALLLICILALIYTLNKIYQVKEPTSSQGSICSSKLDLEKFHHDLHHDLHHHHQHAMGSSSASTHSYSISDDLCHKMPVSDQDVSFAPEDLTSGLGERMLNPRTMARAVGSGKTDHVGNGRFGRVFRGEYHGEDVAVKAFRTIDQDSWKREDTIFRTLNHDNIVRFIASEVTSTENATTEIWMFLEYCPFGSLCDYLDHHEVLGPQQAVKMLYSIINGLNYLHEDYAQASRLYKPSIAHRDIKSKNILMKTPDSCCIADFGHALIKLDEENLDYGKYQHLQVGTVRYMAPEILKPNNTLNYRDFSTFAQADLYQYGLILWEVCQRTVLDILHPAGHHKLPYDGVVPQNPDLQDMIKIVCDDQYRPPRYERWDKYPIMKRLADLMVECWRPNSKARMETLGVKKKLREMYEQITPTNKNQYLINIYNNYSICK